MQLCINLRDCLNLFAFTREKLHVTGWVISHRSGSYQSNRMKHSNQGIEVLRSGDAWFLLPRNTIYLTLKSDGCSLLLQCKCSLCTQWETRKKMNFYLCVSYNWSCPSSVVYGMISSDLQHPVTFQWSTMANKPSTHDISGNFSNRAHDNENLYF